MATRVDVAGILKRRNKKLNGQFAKELATNAYSEWERMVGEMNPRFQDPYRSAMNMYRSGNDIVIELDYGKAGTKRDFVRAIEYGFGGGGIGTSGNYDMRDTLLKSASVKYSQDGSRYLDVPLKMSASQVARLGGESAVEAARKLAYFRAAEDRRASIKRYQFGNPSGYSGLLQPNGRTVKLSGVKTYVPAHHSDPLANLYRFKKPKGDTQQGEFGTFRRISDGPNGKPWVGAPIKQHRLMRRLKNQMPKLIRKTKQEMNL